MSTIGDRLKFMRQSKGFTQQALADSLGICRVQISEYETDKKVPSVQNLAKMADLFGTTMDFIYRGNWG